MAKTIKCFDCGAKVSLQGNECKKCGAPLEHSLEMYEQQRERKSRFRSYVIGVLAILMGFAVVVNGGFLAFFVLLLAGVLIMPITNELIENFNPYDTGGLLKGAGWTLAVIGFFLAMSSMKEHQAENPRPTRVESAKPVTPTEPKPDPSITTSQSSNTDNVKSQSRPMSFDNCVMLQNQSMDAAKGTIYKTSIIVETADLRTIRVCTNDGSVLLTCSRLDGNMVTTVSPHCP